MRVARPILTVSRARPAATDVEAMLRPSRCGSSSGADGGFLHGLGGEDNEEFFAADAADDVGAARLVAKDAGGAAENGVSRRRGRIDR